MKTTHIQYLRNNKTVKILTQQIKCCLITSFKFHAQKNSSPNTFRHICNEYLQINDKQINFLLLKSIKMYISSNDVVALLLFDIIYDYMSNSFSSDISNIMIKHTYIQTCHSMIYKTMYSLSI